ncbi:anti-sigma-k factor [Leptolyngbya sp. Heron Island J]|uniref:anti-sigma factor n=1 Tax=Leptolyngbya sp. Heron Island J TaxID=1385935 RepID=UPI0003B95029|nr:anti-sigma factor [Leptolyngbya sp. Heron Island J]ESA35201.1 anti-sigma-k factor [Leptolyngbya sp. Heron Island J]
MASERKLDEFAADYVAGNLSAEEADEFARLVAEQPELQLEVDRLEKTVGLMLDELPLMQPPQHLRETILAGDNVPVVVRSQRSPITWILGAVAAGATLLSLSLGMSNHRLRLANQQLNDELLAVMPAQQAQLILQQPATRFYDFAGTDNATEAFGSMIVDTDGLQAAIAFENLSPLTEEQTYALWVRHQGEYVFCGVFQPSQEGNIFTTLPMPPVYQSRPWVQDVIVTVESADLPAQPMGPVVAETI